MAIAQETEAMNYQTIVHNAKGRVLARAAVSLRLSIIKDGLTDSVIYSEVHNAETNSKGLVSLTIGTGVEPTGDFKDIDWANGRYSLKVEIDTTGGTSFTDTGTTQILIVPYPEPSKSAERKGSSVKEDELFISRKFVGKFLDFRQTGPKNDNGPNIIWIKTTMESAYGKLSAYGKKCNFVVGDNLYLKRTYYNPGGISGYWVFSIENDASVYYRLTDFQHDRKVPVETWFK